MQKLLVKNRMDWTSLAAQWIRIHLPMQGIWVCSLVWEKPHAIGQLSLHVATTEPVLRSKRSYSNEKPVHHDKEQPLLATTRESPSSQKLKKKKRTKWTPESIHLCLKPGSTPDFV